jgi:hypothetical protein
MTEVLKQHLKYESLFERRGIFFVKGFFKVNHRVPKGAENF